MADKADVKSGTVKAELVDNDLTISGRSKTEVSTETKVEDRTEAPAEVRSRKVEVKTEKLRDGTILEHRQ